MHYLQKTIIKISFSPLKFLCIKEASFSLVFTLASILLVLMSCNKTTNSAALNLNKEGFNSIEQYPAIENDATNKEVQESKQVVLDARLGNKLATVENKKILNSDSLWDIISNDLEILPKYHLSNYQTHASSYLVHKTELLKRSSNRAKSYLYYIYQELKKRDMPLDLAYLPFVESAFYPKAYSHASAVGLWQFISSTGRLYKLNINSWIDERMDFYKATDAALNYLEYLHSKYDDWLLALSGYNAGSGNVNKAIEKYTRTPEYLEKASFDPNYKITFWDIQKYLPRETRHYSPQLLAVAYIIKHRRQLGVDIFDVNNKQQITLVKVNKRIDYPVIAKFANIDQETVEMLNPHFKRGVSAPSGIHRVYLPINNLRLFSHNYKKKSYIVKVPDFILHRVKKGDTLSEIARKYSTNTRSIRIANSMNNSQIYVNERLTIPTNEKKIRISNLSKRNIASNRKHVARNYKKPKGKAIYHRVKSGESLWQIANSYNIKTSALKKYNNLYKAAKIYPKQKLIVGYRDKMKVNTNVSYYKVRRGDNLYDIAKMFSLRLTELQNLNGLSNKSIIVPGQKLTVKNKRKSNSATKDKNAIKVVVSDGKVNNAIINKKNSGTSNTDAKIVALVSKKGSKAYRVGAISRGTHKVKKGDTLYDIAQKYNISTLELKRLNSMTSSKIIPGMKLAVPKGQQLTHKVERGDSLWSIGKRYGVTVQELVKLNNMNKKALSIGAKILIPSVKN